MTSYLASYDVESLRCLNGVREISRHHKEFGIPATFFVVGNLLEDKAWAEELVSYIDDPLFELGNHTYSHLLLKFGLDVNFDFLNKFRDELEKTNQLIFNYFNKSVIGFRSPMGFPYGLKGEKSLLNVLWQSGIRYICTQCVGKNNSIPSPFRNVFYYDEEDILHPILEIPGHGWHDNILKGYNYCPLSWPPVDGLVYPDKIPETPLEEFIVWSQWMNHSVKLNHPYFAPIFHPWSVYRFNQEAETIRLILSYIKNNKINTLSYKDMFEKVTKLNII